MICKKCGGSVRGKEFNTYCEHEFDEPPEPKTVQVYSKTCYGNGPKELIWQAYIPMPNRASLSRKHPLKEEAIREVKAKWMKVMEHNKIPDGYSVGEWYRLRSLGWASVELTAEQQADIISLGRYKVG